MEVEGREESGEREGRVGEYNPTAPARHFLT